jgi:predicted PurR-regulated permease PerM
MTVSFLFKLFLFIYTVFYFLMDGERLLRRILHYIPLEQEDERRMLHMFLSVSRATFRGVLFIGLAQGILAGLALAVAGVPSAVFWGTLMVVLSMIPGGGTGIVWLPASIYLIATDRVAAGVGVILFCALVVGSLDNVLRPRLVGRDAQMHNLLILFSILGGLILFGMVGLLVGPILGALLVMVWELYGVVFRDVLPEAGDAGGDAQSRLEAP